MSNFIPQTVAGVNGLLNQLILQGGLKNDAALARALHQAAPVISKLRAGTLRLGATLLLTMHLEFDISIADLKFLVSGESAASK
jgi:hypothetical protein